MKLECTNDVCICFIIVVRCVQVNEHDFELLKGSQTALSVFRFFSGNVFFSPSGPVTDLGGGGGGGGGGAGAPPSNMGGGGGGTNLRMERGS